MEYFPHHSAVSVTGYPVRHEFMHWEEEAARQAFGLSADLPTLLVFGGSKGARSINRALLTVLPELLEDMQVVHISGSLDWDEVKTASSGLNSEQNERYRVYPFLHEEMGAALRAADLVVSRAGASTLGEFPAFGLPAILVPYPYAWRYQRVNAGYLEERGGAIVIEDSELPAQLLPQVQGLMLDNERRQAMRQTMLTLAKPDAAARIARILLGMTGEPEQERM
jgi:UDP-N-acetylglucosamine--N-acetylmuramyl-(pentapeptide) pyrophosphoryl-undecaprenol N-acetylglucosamine transferase